MKFEEIVEFNNEEIRRAWHNEKWHFSVIDIIRVLAGSERPRKYWNDLKIKLFKEGSELSEKIGQLKMTAEDGKLRKTDVLDTEQLFRLIQSIPSKRVEPFKLWLAKVGKERIDEDIDPELSIKRALKNYLEKGYTEEWINQRLKTIEIRKELTDEWKRAGIENEIDFAILTNDLTKAWSGKSVKEYKELKNLKRQNLRDNMTNLELVLNMLAETSTTEISKKENPETLDESRMVAIKGGNVAGIARKKIEEELREEVVTSKNIHDVNDSIKKRVIIEK